MANVLLLAVFLLSCGFPARAQDDSIFVTAAKALERQLAENKEETGRLKNQVDRLSSMVETLLSRVDSLSAELSEEKVRSAQLEQNSSRTESTTEAPAATTAPADCSELRLSGQRTSGVYTLSSLPSGVQAYCDMDTAGGGWIVIQRRQDGSVPFNRTWEEYKQGFGNKSGEFWFGNENIHHLTSQRNFKLRVDLEDWSGNENFYEYSSFRVSGESDGYRLQIAEYSGNAGDSMEQNNGQKFSTVDRDNDADSDRSCSQEYGQGGWWFGSCGRSVLNGHYLRNCGWYCADWQGVVWYTWRRESYSLKSVSMKIRP
ncbi:ANGPTL7 [Branchiostoma lanceolatum]|uniref:ANGPTL7 protein n=1 Tax=Branchiostoma lanceolatum TaxID=7740 RepID=A0A8J9YR09_BRALA|nr:ANGPTL7 [Branchiostoma lanceolatum]